MQTFTQSTSAENLLWLSDEEAETLHQSAESANLRIEDLLKAPVIDCLGPLAVCMPNLRAAANQWEITPAQLLRVILTNALEYERHDPGLIARLARRKSKQDSERDRLMAL